MHRTAILNSQYLTDLHQGYGDDVSWQVSDSLLAASHVRAYAQEYGDAHEQCCAPSGSSRGAGGWPREADALLRHREAVDACSPGDEYVNFHAISPSIAHVHVLVCHPGLRAHWFTNLGADEHTQARTLFEAVYRIYSEEQPPPPVAPAPEPTPSEMDFLETVGAAPQIPEPADTPIRSECERWFLLEGGRGNLKQPLAWWKVSRGPSLPVRNAHSF